MGALNPVPMISPSLTTKAPTGTSPAIWAARACSSAARMNASSSATVVVVHAVCSVTAPLRAGHSRPPGTASSCARLVSFMARYFRILLAIQQRLSGNKLPRAADAARFHASGLKRAKKHPRPPLDQEPYRRDQQAPAPLTASALEASRVQKLEGELWTRQTSRFATSSN